MAYTGKDEMVSRFGEDELISLTKGTDAIDENVLNRAIADADAMINGFLAGRYALPLPEVPAMLSLLAGDIAFYRLYPLDPTEAAQTRNDAAMRTLRDIADGRVRLPVASGSEPAQGEAVIMTEAPDRMFSAASMRGF